MTHFDRRGRRSVRLKGYDHTQEGAYYLTLCVRDRAYALGKIVDRRVLLSKWGKVAEREWLGLPERYAVQLDAWVIMPDHMHAVIWIRPHHLANHDDASGAIEAIDNVNVHRRSGSRTAPTVKSLGHVVGAFKTVTTKQINMLRGTPGATFWQRDFYERIIRNNGELNRVREYIRRNPQR